MDADHPIVGAARGSGQGSVSFRRHPPPPELRRFIEFLWTWSASDSDGLAEYVPPCMGAEIICRTDEQSGLFVRGPHLQLAEVVIPSRARYVGARLKPGVVSRLFRVPAKDLYGSRTPLEAIGAAAARGLADIDVGGGQREAADRLSHALVGAFRNVEPIDRVTIEAAAVDIIARRHGNISAAALASALGCSTRHLRRKMVAGLGMSPKTAARVARIRRAIALLGASDQPLALVALAAGYGDQAHMTREFAALKAPSPARIRRWSESDFGNTPNRRTG